MSATWLIAFAAPILAIAVVLLWSMRGTRAEAGNGSNQMLAMMLGVAIVVALVQVAEPPVMIGVTAAVLAGLLTRAIIRR